MPTNLKTLLSRSRSRNELKGRGDKDEIPGGVCTCSLNSDVTSATTIAETDSNGPSTTCQCQSIRRTADFPGNYIGTTSSTKAPFTNASLHRREISSRSLFSLPAEGLLMTSRSNTPDISHCPAQYQFTNSQSTVMRKSETVLALTSFTGSSFEESTDRTSSTPGPSPTRIKSMKDRILSTSSSALSTLLPNSAKAKLFSSWKLSSKSTSHTSQDHHHQPTSSPVSLHFQGGIETSSSQVSVYESHGTSPLTPSNRLRRHGSVTNTHQPYWATEISRHSSVSSVAAWITNSQHQVLCRLCLCDVNLDDTVKILNCSCQYCKDCVTAYVSFEVEEAAYEIACPDANCERQGVLTVTEIEALVPSHIVEKHKKFRLSKDVETNRELMWCPTPGCETVCKRKDSNVNGPAPDTIQIIQCTRCQHVYCTECRRPIHSDLSCESYRQKLIRQGKLNLIDEEPFAACDSIKKCPFCHVPIEKSDGCAQMMCKRCKHVFCWYCLSSLDDDFLLRHYDKGPCKNKLGHSRASVVWHRTQVIGIFAGFGLLVLLASPLLILAAPCLLCCRCRYCSSHLDPSDDSPVSI